MASMSARAPLDVDLEDKLLYGLTPIRLAYLLVSLLGGFALWSSPWSIQPVRAVACLFVVGLGLAETGDVVAGSASRKIRARTQEQNDE